MKWLILPIALILMGTTGCAQQANPYVSQESTYHSVGGPRSDADLQAATQVCDAQFGVVRIGADTPANYKQCMLAQGWDYDHTTRSDTYPDPCHPGRTCRNFVFLGMVGSSCSNY